MVAPHREELAALEEVWNRLSQASELPNVFMTYDWFRVWNRGRSGEPRSGLRRSHLLVLKRNGAVAGIAPFIYRSSARFGMRLRRLEFVESPADYYDLSVGNDPAGQVAALVDYWVQTKNEWDYIHLHALRDVAGTKTALQRSLKRASLAYCISPEARCPYLPIQSDWAGTVAHLSARGRKRLKQLRLERLAAKGLRVRIIENPAAEPGLIDKLIVLERQKRVEGRIMSPFLARYPEVFQSLFQTLGAQGWFYVILMEWEERPIAWIMGFRCGRKLWHYQTAYDQAFARLSPGTMLIPRMLDYGLAQGFDEYDFMLGDEPHKWHWASDAHETFRLQVFSRPWLSWAHRVWWGVRRLMRSSS